MDEAIIVTQLEESQDNLLGETGAGTAADCRESQGAPG